MQARVSDVAPARSCASVERHGACPSAGSFSVRLEGPATLWGAPVPYLLLRKPHVPPSLKLFSMQLRVLMCQLCFACCAPRARC